MKLQGCFRCAYRSLLWLYPGDFRNRFAAEMLQLAEAAKPTEWPLIFGDTCLAILRSWFEEAIVGATVQAAGPDGFPAIGQRRLPALRLIQGFVLSIALILVADYVSSLTSLWTFAGGPDCKAVSAEHGPSGKVVPIRTLRH